MPSRRLAAGVAKEPLEVDAARLLGRLDELAAIGRTQRGGVTRLCLSRADVEAKGYIAGLMRRSGLRVHVDEVGNVIGVLGSALTGKPVVAGSHTDTVIDGGRLDGSYGVLAAVEALCTIGERGNRLARPLVAVSFSNEEGVRFPGLTGSRYLCSQVTREEAYSLRDSEGVTYGEAMADSGLATSATAPRWKRGDVDSYIELHIEQGPLLETRRVGVGAVESIVGIIRYDVEVRGSEDHAGTTPLSARRDALVAASEAVLEVRRLARRVGHGAVGTVGRMEVWPGAPNVVPARVVFTVDLRSASQGLLASMSARFVKMIDDISRRCGVTVQRRVTLRLRPTRMSRGIVRLIERQTRSLGLDSMRISSGAGHDAMVMRSVCDAGMVFVPSAGGKSHSPQEATDPVYLVNGANVLANALATLAS